MNSEAIVFVPLTRGLVAVVDWNDYEAKVRGHKWSAIETRPGVFYASRHRKKREPGVAWKTILMHRDIAGNKPGMQVDHHDGDRLNNRRKNLRECTNLQNNRNKFCIGKKTGLKGVGPSNSKSGFCSWISFSGIQITLGSYPTAEEAARAYDYAARRLFGCFARVNFPYPEEIAEGHVSALKEAA